MKQFLKSILSGSLIIIILGIGLVLSLLIIINPIQADRPGLNPSINVAATAEALQTDRQQVKLETTRQVQTAAWNDRLTEAQQKLTQYDDESSRHLSQLQAQLDDLNAQIEQARLDIEAAQQQANRLQQTIGTDKATYQDELAALETQLSQHEAQLRLDLQTTLDQFQAASEVLDSVPPPSDHTREEQQVSEKTDGGQSPEQDHTEHKEHTEDDNKGEKDDN
jgi:ABC-type transporter Mla subunit MlaD